MNDEKTGPSAEIVPSDYSILSVARDLTKAAKRLDLALRRFFSGSAPSNTDALDEEARPLSSRIAHCTTLMITRFYCVKRRVPRSVTENMSLPYLGAMLTSRMGCRTNEDELVVLRFWDPRILLGLPSARDAEQRRHFFAPVVEWTAWEPRRQQYYTITAPPDAAPVPRFAVMPMALSLAQRDQLMYYDKEALYERIVSYWHETCADAIDGLEADMLREVAIAAVARCSSYGIHSADDQVLFASLMMAVSPSFDDHPAVQRGLRDQTVAPDERLDRLIDELPDAVWEQISEEKRYDALFEHAPLASLEQAGRA